MIEMPPRKRTELRAVTPDEKPTPPAATKPKPPTLEKAVEGEDYLTILIALRREMVRDVKDEKGPARAALHRQIALLSKEIAGLQAAAKQEAGEENAGDVPDEDFDASAI